MSVHAEISAKWPSYSGTNPGEWTMNYEGVMEASKSDGRDVVLMFAGALWCPWCKALDENVLTQPTWITAVADTYLVVIDLEQRSGTGAVLLRDADYLDEFGVSTNDVFAKLAAGHVLENTYCLPGTTGSIQAGIQRIYNLPAGTGSIGYPTCIVLKGNAGSYPQSVGRFGCTQSGITKNVNASDYAFVPEAAGLAVTALNNLLTAAIPEIKPFTTPALDSSVTLTNTLANALVHYYRVTPLADTASRFTLQADTDALGSLELFSTATPTTALLSMRNKSLRAGVSFSFEGHQEAYYVKVTLPAAMTYTLACETLESTIQARMISAAVSVKKNAKSVSLSVTLDTEGVLTDTPVSITLTPKACTPDEGFIAAQANVDFIDTPITVTWRPTELRTTKKVAIPLLNPNAKKWEGHKQFAVAISDCEGCSFSSEAAIIETRVTVQETVTRKPGKLSFAGFNTPMVGFASTSSPVLNALAGSTQTVWVARTDGADGSIGATLTHSLDGDLANFIWAADDTAPKSFELIMPDATETATLTLTALQNGATLKSARLGQLPVILSSTNVPCFTAPEGNIFTNLVTGVNADIWLPITNALGGAVSAKIISGKLPAGLKLSLYGNTYVGITGVPTKAERAVVAIQLSTVVKDGKRNVTVIGETLPVVLDISVFTDLNANLAGSTYNAWLDDSGTNVVGTLSLTVTKAGRATLKIIFLDQTITLSNNAWSQTDAGKFNLAGGFAKSGVNYYISLWVDGDALTGVYGIPMFPSIPGLGFRYKYDVTGTRNIWTRANPASAVEGYYTVLLPPNPDDSIFHDVGITNLPSGYGALSLTVVPATGAVRYTGYLADGTALSGSSTLLAFEDEFANTSYYLPVYKLLYSKNGYFGALFNIQPGAQLADNTVALTHGQWLYNGKTIQKVPYIGAFQIPFLEETTGGWYNTKQNLADYYLGHYGFTVTDPGIDYLDKTILASLSTNDLPLNLAFIPGASGNVKLDTNPAKATLTATKTTGFFTGKFNLIYNYTNASNKATVKTISNSHRGILTPFATAPLGGAGYYLLPDNTLPAAYKTHKFSFPVFIE